VGGSGDVTGLPRALAGRLHAEGLRTGGTKPTLGARNPLWGFKPLDVWAIKWPLFDDMIGVLLDTNVVSETFRLEPDDNVVSFLSSDREFWLSTIVVHELDFGVGILPFGQRRDRIAAAVRSLKAIYADRILPVEVKEAESASKLRVQARQAGRVLDIGDALIAATATVNGLALATRNTRDFEGLDLEVANPWF